MENVLGKFAVDTRNKRIWFIERHHNMSILQNVYTFEYTLQGAINVLRNSFLWDIRCIKNELKHLIENTRLKNKPIPQQARLIAGMEKNKESIVRCIAEINDIEKRMEKISEDTYYSGIHY